MTIPATSHRCPAFAGRLDAASSESGRALVADRAIAWCEIADRLRIAIRGTAYPRGYAGELEIQLRGCGYRATALGRACADHIAGELEIEPTSGARCGAGVFASVDPRGADASHVDVGPTGAAASHVDGFGPTGAALSHLERGAVAP